MANGRGLCEVDRQAEGLIGYFRIAMLRLKGVIWVKEKVQPLKIIYALFFEPHTLCYRMFELANDH
ncbi:MAG: hypothetical protein Q8N81_07575 [bacterium]|nr:hypothetical protein [bacterium]